MTYEPARDPFGGSFGTRWAPARDWYPLANGDIGTKELPKYGRALEISIGAAVTLPLLIVVVPVGNADDGATRTLTFSSAGEVKVDRGVRRIVTVAGGATVPAGVQIDVITD